MSEEKEIKTENAKPEEKKQEFLFSEAEYKKFENRRLEYSNALIGTFDEKGEYRITSEILKEFVSIPKVIREIRENRYYAISSSQQASYNYPKEHNEGRKRNKNWKCQTRRKEARAVVFGSGI